MADDKLMSFSEYAKNNGTSYANVSQNVKRHAKELKGHIKKVKGVKMLDEVAVELLNGIKRERKNIFAIADNSLSRENEKLKQELEELKQELESTKQQAQVMQHDYQVNLNDMSKKVISLQDELLSANKKQMLLLADNQELVNRLPFWSRRKYKNKLLEEAPTEEAPEN